MRLLALLVFGVLALTNFEIIESAKILAIFPYPGPSQYILAQPYLKTLAARGHEVTAISAFPHKEKIPNFRDITVKTVIDGYDETLLKFMDVKMSKWTELNAMKEFVTGIATSVLKNEEVQHLLHSNTEQFDLVIVETLHLEPLAGIAQHFNASLIGISTCGTDTDIDDYVGNTSPISYIPSYSAGFTDRMNFCQRLENFAYDLVEWLHKHTVHWPHQVAIYKEYFPQAKMDLMEVRKSFSLVLLNQHFSLSFPRPYVPNMIEVGGFHINHKPAPLPQDIEAFVNGSEHGVIYFSMGSNVKTKFFSKEKLQILMNAFGSLKERVLWKFEDPDLPGKPDNVFISKWFPQEDILAHPKVKLFYTHGGLLSTIEAIYHGKPVVGMPMFFDQFLNVERAKKAGFGLGVDYHTLNEKDLKEALLGVLNNSSYSEKAAKMSQRYRDQPMNPLDKAIYWTEYVLRHKGAPHMRVAAQDLNILQLHSLDTAAVLFGGLFLAVLGVLFIAFKLLKFVFSKKSSNKRKQKKQ